MVFLANDGVRVTGPVNQVVFVLAFETHIGGGRFQVTVRCSVQFADIVFEIETIFADVTAIRSQREQFTTNRCVLQTVSLGVVETVKT
jgi:hypothetical protein